MKFVATALFVATLLAHSSLAADEKAKSPLLGAWAVDVSRLHMALGSRPKSVTITFSLAETDSLRTRVDVVDATGKRLQADGVTPLDGAPTQVKSNFEADISATIMPSPEVLIMQLGKNGIPASTRIYLVTPDGNSMVETVAYFGTEGQPILRRNHFSRIR